MVVTMKVSDPGWIAPYFENVGPLLVAYGAVQLAGGLDIVPIEGNGDTPDRIAVFAFPDMTSLNMFMADDRYQTHRALRHAGSKAEIFAFENLVVPDRLV